MFSNNQSFFQINPSDLFTSPKNKLDKNTLTPSKSEKKLLFKGNYNNIRTASTRYSLQNSKELTGNNNYHNSNLVSSVNKNIITLENNCRNNEKVDHYQ